MGIAEFNAKWLNLAVEAGVHQDAGIVLRYASALNSAARDVFVRERLEREPDVESVMQKLQAELQRVQSLHTMVNSVRSGLTNGFSGGRGGTPTGTASPTPMELGNMSAQHSDRQRHYQRQGGGDSPGRRSMSPGPGGRSSGPGRYDSRSSGGGRVPSAGAKQCHRCHGYGHLQQQCPSPRHMTERQRATQCFTCKGWGHWTDVCPSARQGGGAAPQQHSPGRFGSLRNHRPRVNFSREADRQESN